MKRILDLILTIIGLIIFAPAMIFIALLVKIKFKSTPFFKQSRLGLKGTSFSIFKFKTMTDHKDKNGNLLPDEDRITKFGKFLRSTSLDELPSLYNVLKGEMSLVGPRPLLPEYLPLYSKKQARRHDIIPGLTGWAQVNGRNAISWEKKFQLDVWYVDNQSFWLDIKILLLTIKKVITRDGINYENSVSMRKFKGNLKNEK